MIVNSHFSEENRAAVYRGTEVISYKILPDDLIKEIFHYLGDVDLAVCREVSRGWRQLGNELRLERILKTFHLDTIPADAASVDMNLGVKIFGVKAWRKYGGLKVDTVPPIPMNIIEKVKRFRDLIKVKEDCTFFLIPKELKGSHLKELIIGPQTERGVAVQIDGTRIDHELEGIQIDHSYWILMSDKVIGWTRNLLPPGFARQKALVAKETGGECRAPDLLEAAVCCFMNQKSKGITLFGEEPLRNPLNGIVVGFNYTRCQGAGEIPWVVGDGPRIFKPEPEKTSYLGVALCQKFSEDFDESLS